MIRSANKKLSPFMGEGFYVGKVGSTRSLNLHTAALERRLYLFRANKLRSLSPTAIIRETLPSFARSAKECLSQWTGILTMFHI